MSKIEIRKAQKNDTISVSGLLLQLGYDSAPSEVEHSVLMQSDGTDRIYVGVQNKQVVAVMSIIFFNYFPSAEKICRITAIVVDEKMRGSGIGSTLIDYAKSVASSEKCHTLEVTTSLRREQTQAYYESIGFHKTSYKYVQKL